MMAVEGLRVGADLRSQGRRLQGLRLGGRSPGGPGQGEQRCAARSKGGPPHNLQKSKPCSLGSINRPQIESDPFRISGSL